LDAFNEIESAKTGKLLDYVEIDKSLLNIFDLQDDVDLINHMYDYGNIVNAGASLSRNSNCTGDQTHMVICYLIFVEKITCILSIKVITKLPNSEQSYKGKVKTHNYINRQNQSTTEKL
jgi:hypothetical protein